MNFIVFFSAPGWMAQSIQCQVALCLRLMPLCWLDVQLKGAQGQVGASLIKSMCSTEAPLCNAIKQVYRSQLPTFFSPTFHLCDKMPSPCSENNSPLTDSSRIMIMGKRVRWEGMGGNNLAPQSHHAGCRLPSILSVTLPGRRTACSMQRRACWLVVGKMSKKGWQDRILRPGPWEEKPPDPTAAGAAQAPLTIPLNRWMQEGLVWAEWCDWNLCCVNINSLCLHSRYWLLTSGFWTSQSYPS